MRRNNKRGRKVQRIVKKVQNATKVEAFGIKFKSKLEKFTYEKLIENGIKNFKYEEDKFTLVEAFEYIPDSIEAYDRTDRTTKQKQRLFGLVDSKIRPMTYLPDFTCIKPDKTGWILEVKGYSNDSFPIKWKIFKEYLNNNGYNITLYKPNNQGNVLKTIELIKEKYK